MCLGSQANKSPPAAKGGKKRSRSGPPKGTTPNITLLAFSDHHVSGHLMYRPLPPNVAKQLSPEWFVARHGHVTASRLSALFGFYKDAATVTSLGLSSSWRRDDAAQEASEEIISSVATLHASSIPMEWGRAHEGNMLLSFLEGPAKDLPMFKDYSIQVQECSFIQVDVNKLPSSIISGLPTNLLPPMGASPDGMLLCSARDGSGRKMQLPIECKAACPFHVDTGPSAGGAWKYEPQFGAWGQGRVPPPYYAQCQMTMLATECSQMVLMQYLPQTTTIYLVERDDAWAWTMLHLLGINMSVLLPKRPAGLSALLALPQGAQGFQRLLRLTKEGAARVRELAKVDSINNGVDSQPFLD